MTAGTKWGRMASLAVLCAVAACSTTNLEELAPASTAQPAPPAAVAADASAAQNPPSLSRPGDYPNLNIIPVPAADQFTDEQRDAEAGVLRQRRQQLSAGGDRRPVTDSGADLRRLARTHGEEAIKAIEAE